MGVRKNRFDERRAPQTVTVTIFMTSQTKTGTRSRHTCWAETSAFVECCSSFSQKRGSGLASTTKNYRKQFSGYQNPTNILRQIFPRNYFGLVQIDDYSDNCLHTCSQSRLNVCFVKDVVVVVVVVIDRDERSEGGCIVKERLTSAESTRSWKIFTRCSPGLSARPKRTMSLLSSLYDVRD